MKILHIFVKQIRTKPIKTTSKMETKVSNKREKVKMPNISHLLPRKAQTNLAIDFNVTLGYVNAVVQGNRFNADIYKAALQIATTHQQTIEKASDLARAANELLKINQ